MYPIINYQAYPDCIYSENELPCTMNFKNIPEDFVGILQGNNVDSTLLRKNPFVSLKLCMRSYLIKISKVSGVMIDDT